MLDGGDVTCKAVSVSCMSSTVDSAAVSGGVLSVLSLTVGCSRASVSTPALLLSGRMRVVFGSFVLAKRDTRGGGELSMVV